MRFLWSYNSDLVLQEGSFAFSELYIFLSPAKQMAADKQLIIVIETTARMGYHWPTIVSDYLEKIIKSFCGIEITGQKPSASTGTVQSVEFALVMFSTKGPFSDCVLQRSGWTRDVDNYLGWLSSLSFSGGGLEDVAVTEGLADALMMFAIPQNGVQTTQNLDGKRHCILIAASNPFPLPTPVYRPQIENPDQAENAEDKRTNHLYDTETVAKWFGQCNISLSVISPRQLQKYIALYNAAKHNTRGADPPVDVKQPHFLVLIAENFMEARAALSRTGWATNQIPVTSLPPASGPSVALPPGNVSTINRSPISVGNIPQATVKVEPSTVASMVSTPPPTHMQSVPRPASQSVSSVQTTSSPTVSQEIMTSNETHDLKPIVSLPQSVRPVNAILNQISQARVMNSSALTNATSLGLQSMGGNPISMNMSNMVSSGMASSAPPNQSVLPHGQSGIATVSGSGTGTSQPMQNPAASSFTAAPSNVPGNSSMAMPQQLSNLSGSGNMVQTVSSQGNVPTMKQSGTGLNPNIMTNLSASGATSNTGTMIPTPGMSQPMQPVMQAASVSNSAANISMQQAPQQSKYVKVWEGNLSGQRQGQPVFITRLEGYRNSSASESLAANWPQTMQIVRLISQDHMNNKQYVGKADFLVFRAMNQHGFLQQLQEKKLCAVIQLPSQTLLLSVSDKACRLIGMLFPGDMVVFKPQISSQQQQQHNQQMQQQQQHPQLQQLQQQQQQLQQLQQQQQQQQPPLQQLQQQQPLQQMQQQQQPLQQIQQQQQPLQQMQQQQQQQQAPIQQLHQQQQQMQQHPPIQQQQQLSQLQQQQQHLPQIQQPQQLSQLQQQSQPQQVVGAGMGQAYVQGPGRPQLASQGQVSSQGPQNMSGGGFMN